MSDLQFSRGGTKLSGRTGVTFSPAVLILFGVPFLLLGLIALAAAIHDPKQKNVSVAFSVGGIFVCVGLGIIIAGFGLRKKTKQRADLHARNPDKPWLWRADWADGKVKASTMAQPTLWLFMGLAFCSIGGVSIFFGLPEVWQKHNYAALLVLLFPLAGLLMFAVFFAAWRSQKRFGECSFELAQTPIPLGGVLEGMIQTGKLLKLEHELHLKFSCVRQITTVSDNDRSTDEYILWQDEKIYSEQANLPEPEPGHTGIPVHFKLPADQPECYSRGNESVFWRLEAKSKMRGPDFHALFEIPVFKVAGAKIESASAATDEDSDPTAALQAPIGDVRRDENSKITVSDGSNGREFYFPAARNVGAALLSTLGMFLCIGVLIVQPYFHAPIVFKIIFTIVFGGGGILLMLGTFSLWFKSVRITVNSTNVRLTKHWLLFGGTRDFSTGDYARFATKTGMQSGSTIFTDIKLIKRGGDGEFAANNKEVLTGVQGTIWEADQDAARATEGANPPIVDTVKASIRQAAGPPGITVASGIASAAEANWLVAEMNKALQQGQPSSGFSTNGRKTDSRPAKMAGALLILAAVALACVTGYWYWRHTNSVPPTQQAANTSRTAETPKTVTPKPVRSQPAALTVAFSSFGPHGECATNGLAVESDGHADWFVAKSSGRLGKIELKVEPTSAPIKRLVVSIAEDNNGVPGTPLETFHITELTHTNTLGWRYLNSRRRPALEANKKYWINARSLGKWYWHFNNQNLMQDSLRSPRRRKWVSAGYGNVCAFSVLIETNQP